MARRLAAEALGTFFLLAAIAGSGIAAERYAVDPGVALLVHAGAIGAALAVLIAMYAPISGAHFNPAVTLMFRLRGEIGTGEALAYAAAQTAAGVLGVWVSHAMYDEALLQWGAQPRGGLGAFIAEGVATFGLVATILFVRAAQPAFVAGAVGLFIFSAIWFTASTAFANPAVTIARTFTDTYVGIAAKDAPGFIAAQLLGGVAAAGVFAWFDREDGPARD